MEEITNSVNQKNRILVSRNTPLALVVGVAGFIGSSLTERLIDKNIQVIGVDNFETGTRENLDRVAKSNKFHLISESIGNFDILKELFSDLSRLDYAFFVVESEDSKAYENGVLSFLNLLISLKESAKLEKADTKDRPKITLVTSINLYDIDLNDYERVVKNCEVKFAKFIKENKLNARIVRLAGVFGPKMNFRIQDPIIKLIQASLNNQLQTEQLVNDFSTRALYIDEACDLILKSALSGSTAHKIYDGARLQPIKVSEIKQILLDPIWHETKGFKETELPPWPTPNLEKTIKDLSWRPKINLIKALKETIAYFKERNIKVPKVKKEVVEETRKDDIPDVSRWSFNNPDLFKEDEDEREREDKLSEEEVKNRLKRRILTMIIFLVVIYGLVYPVIKIGVGVFSIRAHIQQSKIALETGNFDKADSQIVSAKQSLTDTLDIIEAVSALKKVGLLSGQIQTIERSADLANQSLDGLSHGIKGSRDLYQASKIVSSEETGDIKALFGNAQTELNLASQKISKVNADLTEEEFFKSLPAFLKPRVEDLSVKLVSYQDILEKARTASLLLPELVAVEGKKSYLVLFQNNLELRPGGGFIGSYGKLDFENGKLKNIKVDDIYNLDGGLTEVIEPPAELKSDLGANRLYLRDSNFDPDFPTSARTAELLYKKASGESVNGVIAMDLSASSKLLSAVGGFDLPEYGESVNGDNLFEKAISHAEVNFFPGSQAKRNYLTALQTQLFNKIFFLSKQNWPAVIQAIGTSLEEKHVLLYLSDADLFSYLASENWAGVMPRGTVQSEDELKDFIAVSESNMGANKANYYLERRFKVDTAIAKDGGVSQKIAVNYKNNSPSDVFPAGKYKNRFKIFIPLGSKLTRVVFSDEDITSKVTSFSDYGRTGYSVLIEILPKQQKTLILEYTLADSLKFKENLAKYKLDIIKQPGTDKDPLEWSLTFPINLQVVMENGPSPKLQEININSDLIQDRTFQVLISKK